MPAALQKREAQKEGPNRKMSPGNYAKKRQKSLKTSKTTT